MLFFNIKKYLTFDNILLINKQFAQFNVTLFKLINITIIVYLKLYLF